MASCFSRLLIWALYIPFYSFISSMSLVNCDNSFSSTLALRHKLVTKFFVNWVSFRWLLVFINYCIAFSSYSVWSVGMTWVISAMD